MTIDEFKTLRAASASSRRNKFGAVKSGGYDSRKEHRRANQLKLMQRAGVISNLREQVPFILIPAQYGGCGTDFKGKPVRICLERACKYYADFVYEMGGKTIVEDTKGLRTKEYIIKRKLMLYVHGIRIKEV